MLIPLASVEIRKRQRTEISSKALNELKESILTVGLLHPPVMWQDGSKWVLSVGERRLRAIQELSKEAKTFWHSGVQVVPGGIPITPLGDYLDEIGRFEAELHENIHREEISWQDRSQALADLHKMRLSQNPAQTLSDTGRELSEREGRSVASSQSRVLISESLTIVAHLNDPAIASARNQHEAMGLILRKEEAHVNAELIRRKLVSMDSKPLIEVRHGNSTQIMPLLEPGTFDLILADPPYGIDAGAAGFRSRTVHHHNYEDDPETARTLAKAILTEGFRLTKPRANVFMFGAIEYFDWWKQVAGNMGWVPFNRPLIWIKSESEGMAPWGAQGPRITTEFIFYATKGQKGLVASPIDVFTVKRVSRAERVHAAEKPVELLQKLIECSTLPGDSVLDPCCGSGSTLVACREAKRVGLGIEKSETYFNIALSNVHGGTNGDGQSSANDLLNKEPAKG